MGSKSIRTSRLTALMFLGFAGISLASAAPEDEKTPQPTATLELTFVEIDPEEGGDVVATLYRGKDGWLKPEGVLLKSVGEVDGDTLLLKFENVPFGDDYAIQVFHDANRNGELDFRRVIPIPAEGVGVSNNHERMGPPSFDKAKFNVDRSELSLRIVLRYY